MKKKVGYNRFSKDDPIESESCSTECSADCDRLNQTTIGQDDASEASPQRPAEVPEPAGVPEHGPATADGRARARARGGPAGAVAAAEADAVLQHPHGQGVHHSGPEPQPELAQRLLGGVLGGLLFRGGELLQRLGAQVDRGVQEEEQQDRRA